MRKALSVLIFLLLVMNTITLYAADTEGIFCGRYYIRNVYSGKYLGYSFLNPNDTMVAVATVELGSNPPPVWNVYMDANQFIRFVVADDPYEKTLIWGNSGDILVVPTEVVHHAWNLSFYGGNNFAFFEANDSRHGFLRTFHGAGFVGFGNCDDLWPMPKQSIWTFVPVGKPSIQLTPFPPGERFEMILKFAIGEKFYTDNGYQKDIDAAPYIDGNNDRAMVPVRFIAEAFGADVNWNDNTKTCIINLNSKTIRLSLNQPLPNRMGNAAIKNDRLFVPIRYVAEQFETHVNWYDFERIITIYKR